MPSRSTIVAVGALTLAGATFALTGTAGSDTVEVAEIPDAGGLPATAQVIEAGVHAITGNLDSSNGDTDLYAICVGDEGLSVSTRTNGTQTDTQLLVFAADGSAIAYNDDMLGWQSEIVLGAADLAAGTYLVAVNGTWTDALNEAGQPVFAGSASGAVAGPNPNVGDHRLASWDVVVGDAGDYRVDIIGSVACDGSGTEAPTDVVVDVKPGSDDNALNPRAKGVTPIAVLGSDAVDAAAIHPDSVVVTAGEATAAATHAAVEDVDGDGVPDLVVQVPTQDLELTGDTDVCVDATAGEDEHAIHGCDAVTVVGGGGAAEAASERGRGRP